MWESEDPGAWSEPGPSTLGHSLHSVFAEAGRGVFLKPRAEKKNPRRLRSMVGAFHVGKVTHQDKDLNIPHITTSPENAQHKPPTALTAPYLPAHSYQAQGSHQKKASSSSSPPGVLATETQGRIQKVDPPWSSIIYTIGVIQSRIGGEVLLLGSCQGSGHGASRVFACERAPSRERPSVLARLGSAAA